MAGIGEHIKTADWKTEKHVPVIECPDRVKAGEFFDIHVTLGKEVAHPNTTEHHISSITLYFLPEGGQFLHQVGHYEFSAHGEHTSGPNQGPVHTFHGVTTSVSLKQTGLLLAVAMCNIHGLWESSKVVYVE